MHARFDEACKWLAIGNLFTSEWSLLKRTCVFGFVNFCCCFVFVLRDQFKVVNRGICNICSSLIPRQCVCVRERLSVVSGCSFYWFWVFMMFWALFSHTVRWTELQSGFSAVNYLRFLIIVLFFISYFHVQLQGILYGEFKCVLSLCDVCD